jgi:divalent metal cation (Fe/Co/Zn/Cd) transporter
VCLLGRQGVTRLVCQFYDEAVAEFVQLGAAAEPSASHSRIVWLQAVTIVWMLVECGVALYAAAMARSPALLAFGSDSLIELASASMVLLQFVPAVRISERKAGRGAAVLLYLLAAAVTAIAAASLIRGYRPETTFTGVAITIAALIVMPMLSTLKRREARRSGNAALAADAVQSATCAYLALTALAGVLINALWHVSWIDPVAALVAVPFLVQEGRSAWQGVSCCCC